MRRVGGILRSGGVPSTSLCFLAVSARFCSFSLHEPPRQTSCTVPRRFVRCAGAWWHLVAALLAFGTAFLPYLFLMPFCGLLEFLFLKLLVSVKNPLMTVPSSGMTLLALMVMRRTVGAGSVMRKQLCAFVDGAQIGRGIKPDGAVCRLGETLPCSGRSGQTTVAALVTFSRS